MGSIQSCYKIHLTRVGLGCGLLKAIYHGLRPYSLEGQQACFHTEVCSDYSGPKSNKPIILSSFVLKTLDWLVDRYIQNSDLLSQHVY